MSKQPLGKTLLRNVIRHTDAHNKIQEETEMWKQRNWEVHKAPLKHLSDTRSVRGQMHCDRVPDQSRDPSRGRERVSEHDDREARYWSRKLYEFEANDPDRWGHSGFKELYPEEFESDSEKKKIGRHKMKKSKSDTSLSKRSKKSSRKKKKKRKKKEEEEKRKKAESSSSDSSSSSSDDSGATKDKQRRKRTKSRHKNKKQTRGRDEESSSDDSDDEGERERRTHRRKKRKQDSHKDSDSGPNSKKKSRKSWKAAGERSSDDSSGD